MSEVSLQVEVAPVAPVAPAAAAGAKEGEKKEGEMEVDDKPEEPTVYILHLEP